MDHEEGPGMEDVQIAVRRDSLKKLQLDIDLWEAGLYIYESCTITSI